MMTLQPAATYALGLSTQAVARIRDTSLARWKGARFTHAELADPLISGDSADPDGDGLPNLLEYGLGLDPLVADSSGRRLRTLPGDDGRPWLRYVRSLEAEDAFFSIIKSTNLVSGTWSNTTGKLHCRHRETSADGTEEVIYVEPAVQTNAFYRLRITVD